MVKCMQHLGQNQHNCLESAFVVLKANSRVIPLLSDMFHSLCSFHSVLFCSGFYYYPTEESPSASDLSCFVVLHGTESS